MELVKIMRPPLGILGKASRVTKYVPMTLMSTMRRKTASTAAPGSSMGVMRSSPALLMSTSMRGESAESPTHGLAIRDVAAQCLDGPAGERRKLGGGGFHWRIVGQNGEVGAGARETLGDAVTDAAAGPRYQHRFAVKIEDHTPHRSLYATRSPAIARRFPIEETPFIGRIPFVRRQQCRDGIARP